MAADRTAVHPPHLVMIAGRMDVRRPLMAVDRIAARRLPRTAAAVPTDALCLLMVGVAQVAQCHPTAGVAVERRLTAAVAAEVAVLREEASAEVADTPLLRATAPVAVVALTAMATERQS